MSEFFAMGGYAKYVWPAYSISLVALTLAVVLSRKALTATRRKVARYQQSMSETTE